MHCDEETMDRHSFDVYMRNDGVHLHHICILLIILLIKVFQFKIVININATQLSINMTGDTREVWNSWLHPGVWNRAYVVQSLVSVFCGKLSFFLLVIALSVRLKFTACDCIFGILRLFFLCLSYRDIFQTFWKEVAVSILIVIHLIYFLLRMTIIDGVMVSLLNVRISWILSRSGQIKDFRIATCCFSVDHAALRTKS